MWFYSKNCENYNHEHESTITPQWECSLSTTAPPKHHRQHPQLCDCFASLHDDDDDDDDQVSFDKPLFGTLCDCDDNAIYTRGSTNKERRRPVIFYEDRMRFQLLSRMWSYPSFTGIWCPTVSFNAFAPSRNFREYHSQKKIAAVHHHGIVDTLHTNWKAIQFIRIMFS